MTDKLISVFDMTRDPRLRKLFAYRPVECAAGR